MSPSGGGRSGAPLKDGDGHTVGPRAPVGRTSRRGQHHAAHPGPLPLAWPGGRSKGFLPSLPGLPEDVPQASSSYTAHSAAHHTGALRAHRDGSGGAVTKVSPGTRTHPCHRGLCHPVPRSHTSTKSHRKEHRSGAIYAFQPGGHTSGDLDRSGNPFMSRLMADLCRLLRVKQLRTTVYHPQTDGLVERFNQTLKQMLRRVAAEDRRDWDQMLPYVLFGIRDVPQASTGFTPFELLFGRQPRGLLDVAKEA